MITQERLQLLVNAFSVRAQVLTGDPKFGVGVTPQPAPLLAIVLIAWRPNGDQSIQACQMVRHIPRDPDDKMPMLEQYEGWFTIILAEIERAAHKPTIH